MRETYLPAQKVWGGGREWGGGCSPTLSRPVTGPLPTLGKSAGCPPASPHPSTGRLAAWDFLRPPPASAGGQGGPSPHPSRALPRQTALPLKLPQEAPSQVPKVRERAGALEGRGCLARPRGQN